MSIEENNQFEKLTKYILDNSRNNSIDGTIIDEWKFLYNQAKSEINKYNKSKIDLIQLPKEDNEIIITMTSCKRYNLFTQTVNSIINHWLDLDRVSRWIVIDDNSSDEDREEMKTNYPFIEYYMKTYEERGHVQSMDIIYDYLEKLNPKYWIHIEDDMLFFAKLPYITLGLNGLEELSYFNVKQVLFNRNYAETIDHVNMDGHIVYGTGDFSLHDYKEYGTGCRYWPYFSFRPGITDVQTILELGRFKGSTTFFEQEYAYKYMNAGYRTAFINSITHLHIGRLCNSSGDNAYILNNIPQFNGQKSIEFNIKVINLKRREDRLKTITEKLQRECLPFELIEAVDGTKLTLNTKLKALFKDNDFNYRRGVVGCALSHYNLWQKLVKSNSKYYLILEDDVTLCKDFKNKLTSIEKYLNIKSILFLGYHMFDDNREKNPKYVANSNTIVIDYLKRNLFIGGTHCYSITKAAAQGLIDYIDMYGIKHGIDYLMGRKQIDVATYETIPHLAFAEYSIKKISDTDIQNDSTSLLTTLPRSVIEITEKNTVVDISNINIVEEEEFVFIKGVDQQNNDIDHKIDDRSIDKLKIEAIELEDCVAFNTLGFFKNEITELTFSDYYGPKDGIYIKKSYYDTYLKKTNENNWIQYIYERSD